MKRELLQRDSSQIKASTIIDGANNYKFNRVQCSIFDALTGGNKDGKFTVIVPMLWTVHNDRYYYVDISYNGFFFSLELHKCLTAACFAPTDLTQPQETASLNTHFREIQLSRINQAKNSFARNSVFSLFHIDEDRLRNKQAF